MRKPTQPVENRGVVEKERWNHGGTRINTEEGKNRMPDLNYIYTDERCSHTGAGKMGTGERSNRKKGRRNRPSAKAASAGAAVQRPASHAGRNWLLGLILVAALFVVYAPAVWHANFVWDDVTVVTTNPVIVGPLGLKEIWTTGAADLCPLTLTTFWVEHQLWGLAPLPYHLVNVFLQACCAILLWLVLRELQVPGAWLGAALWALHPVEVASVAWISEMKNTESGVFFLLSILFFVRWLKARDAGGQSGGGWNYACMVIFAALAMASKSSTVILPGVLCLCAWWVERRWQWRNLARVAADRADVRGVEHPANHDAKQGAAEPRSSVGSDLASAVGRCRRCSLVLPRETVLATPTDDDISALAPRYPWFAYVPLLAVLVAFFVLWLKRDTWARSYFFIFAYFLLALLPVLGLVDSSIFRLSLVFDHFQYLASMGPVALAGAGIARLADAIGKQRHSLRFGLYAIALLTLGLLTQQQAQAYQTDETLFFPNESRNPSCWACYNILGKALLSSGRTQEAIAQYKKSIEIFPNNYQVHDDLGATLLAMGNVDEAIPHFYRALQLNPSYANAHYDLGNALMKRDRLTTPSATTVSRSKILLVTGGLTPALALLWCGKEIWMKG